MKYITTARLRDGTIKRFTVERDTIEVQTLENDWSIPRIVKKWNEAGLYQYQHINNSILWSYILLSPYNR